MVVQILSVFKYFVKTFIELRSEAAKYIFYTGIIALLLLSILLWGIWKFSGLAGDYLSQSIPWEWAQNSMMFSVVIGISVIVLSWIVFKYILLMALSPLLSIISEKLEIRIQGHNSGRGFSLTASAARGIRINTRNIIKEIIMTFLLLIASLVPGINLVALGLLFLVQAYFAGFGIMDFYLERHYTFRESIGVVYSNKWAAIAIGSIFTALLFIPILGVLVAPYLCTAAATQYFLNKGQLSRSSEL